ncbi:MAG: Uma2 family endonuclease [Cyanobacteria bacterium P01_F01_bin.86]
MTQATVKTASLYPDSDGKPMAENTQQYRWIVRLVTNLRQLFQNQTAFVAGDLFWYPIQVDEPPALSQAPDAMVVLGRPDGDRLSYKQWEEDNVIPQVVFEIISPSNSASEIAKKQAFYDRYGVLEMFFYDPEDFEFWGLTRPTPDSQLTLLTRLNLPWTSPTLGIKFDMFDDGLALFYPNGEPFKDPEDLFLERAQAQAERDQAQIERDQAQLRLNRAIAKLQELGIDPTELE